VPDAVLSTRCGPAARLKAYVLLGLAFMLLPGTFLGVWNLISISDQHSKAALSPSWIQAHGQAQIFGRIGSFVIGIGFFSLSKMGELKTWVIDRAWASWAFWATGVSTRWVVGVYIWNWRLMLPLSCALECAGFLVFFITVRQHKPSRTPSALPVLSNNPTGWMRLVVAGTFGSRAALLWNLTTALRVAVENSSPQYPKSADQSLLTIAIWGFLILTVWGFQRALASPLCRNAPATRMRSPLGTLFDRRRHPLGG
jgi:uncharacterized protein involved in response to NO